MWKIKQIFDGDYGCEELQPGQKPKVSTNSTGSMKMRLCGTSCISMVLGKMKR